MDRYGQKWVWTVWSQDFKIGCISKMNGWNKLKLGITTEFFEKLFLLEKLGKWAKNKFFEFKEKFGH